MSSSEWEIIQNIYLWTTDSRRLLFYLHFQDVPGVRAWTGYPVISAGDHCYIWIDGKKVEVIF